MLRIFFAPMTFVGVMYSLATESRLGTAAPFAVAICSCYCSARSRRRRACEDGKTHRGADAEK